GASFEYPVARRVREKNIQRVEKAIDRIASEVQPGHLALEKREQLSRQLSHSLPRLVETAGGDCAGCAQTDAECDIFSAGTNSALLPRSHNKRRQLNALADIQRADPFWGIELMSRNGQQVDAQLPDADRNFAHRLRGIRMNECTAPFRFARNSRDWLNRSDFILRMDDRDDSRLVIDCACDIVRGNDAVPLRRNTPDPVA